MRVRSSGFRTARAWALGLALLLASASTVVLPSTARAQSPPTPPPGSPIPRILPQATPNLAPGPAEPGPSSAPGITGSVAITDVSVEGATAYDDAVLQALVGGLTGSDVPRQKVEQARLAILDLYRRDGAVFTAVIARLIGQRLRLVVTEGYIAQVEIEGDVGPVRAQILRFLEHLREQRPLKAAALERWMLLVTDIPGISAAAVLRPSTAEPGALTLVAQVARKTISGLALLDNRAYQYTGPGEGLIGIDINSLTAVGERTSFSFFHSFDDTQIFGQASSEMFLGGSGLRLKLYAGAGNTTPSGPLAQLDYLQFTTIFGAQLSYPLIRERQQTLSLVGNFDAVQSLVEDNQGPAGSTTRVSYDSLRVLRLGADYAWLDLWAGETRTASNSASAKLSQGLPLLGATANGAADSSRQGERTDFTKLTAEASRTQALFSPWPTSTVSLHVAAAGQFTRNVLPPVEKFYLGGARLNRGYYAGQVTGDSALAATAEAQLDMPVTLPGDWSFAPTAQFYAFYDWGQTWESRTSDAGRTLRSTGLGMRLYPTGTTQYEFDLEGVKRLTAYPNGSGPGVSPLIGTTLYWQLLVRY